MLVYQPAHPFGGVLYHKLTGFRDDGELRTRYVADEWVAVGDRLPAIVHAPDDTSTGVLKLGETSRRLFTGSAFAARDLVKKATRPTDRTGYRTEIRAQYCVVRLRLTMNDHTQLPC